MDPLPALLTAPDAAPSVLSGFVVEVDYLKGAAWLDEHLAPVGQPLFGPVATLLRRGMFAPPGGGTARLDVVRDGSTVRIAVAAPGGVGANAATALLRFVVHTSHTPTATFERAAAILAEDAPELTPERMRLEETVGAIRLSVSGEGSAAPRTWSDYVIDDAVEMPDHDGCLDTPLAIDDRDPADRFRVDGVGRDGFAEVEEAFLLSANELFRPTDRYDDASDAEAEIWFQGDTLIVEGWRGEPYGIVALAQCFARGLAAVSVSAERD